MEMMATFALPCGMLGVIFRFTNELTHGSRFDSKPIGCKLLMYTLSNYVLLRFPANALNKPRSRVPYQHALLHPDYITVYGMPAGLLFKKPSSYKTEEMREIIKCQTNLIMTGN